MVLRPILVLKLTLFIATLVISGTSRAQCKVSELVDGNKIKILPPYRYDGFLMNEFTFDQLNKTEHLEFIAFKNQSYQLIFYSSGFEEIVTISVYDKKDPAVKIAEKTINSDTTNWVYQPPKAGTYSITYEISPSDTEIEHPGCMVMLIAFSKIK